MYEAESNLGENGSAVPKLEEARTSDIESDEADIFERRRKFGELSKRLDAHRKETLKLRGNDLRYNMYIKKIQKLTRKDLGLDLEAYKDFVNNLKQFAHVNADFEIFAKDNLKLNDPEYRELIRLNGEIVTSPSDITEAERVKLRTADIYNTLRKLKREYDSHLVDKDRKNIEEFTKDVRKYLQADWDLFEFVKAFYIRRKKEVADRDKQTKIEFDKITPGDLKKAGLSQKDFEQIKMLHALDKELFQPHVYGARSTHSMVVNVSKYGPELSKEAKEILYRPPKMRALYEKYWQLAKVAEGKTKKELDYDLNIKFNAIYPKKTTEELNYIDLIFTKLDLAVEEDIRALIAEEKNMKQL